LILCISVEKVTLQFVISRKLKFWSRISSWFWKIAEKICAWWGVSGDIWSL